MYFSPEPDDHILFHIQPSFINPSLSSITEDFMGVLGYRLQNNLKACGCLWILLSI